MGQLAPTPDLLKAGDLPPSQTHRLRLTSGILGSWFAWYIRGKRVRLFGLHMVGLSFGGLFLHDTEIRLLQRVLSWDRSHGCYRGVQLALSCLDYGFTCKLHLPNFLIRAFYLLQCSFSFSCCLLFFLLPPFPSSKLPHQTASSFPSVLPLAIYETSSSVHVLLLLSFNTAPSQIHILLSSTSLKGYPVDQYSLNAWCVCFPSDQQ